MQLDDLNRFTGPVTPLWFGRGIWLSQAWSKVPSTFFAEAEERAKKIAEIEGNDQLAAFLIISNAPEISPPQYFAPKQLALWKQFCLYRRMAIMGIITNMKVNGGPLYAFGSSSRAGANFEWIPILAWKQLALVEDQKDIVEGGGNIYYDVHVLNPDKWNDPPADDVVAALSPAAPHSGIQQAQRRRGPGASKKLGVIAAMESDIKSGTISARDLSKMLEKNLEQRYRASRDTVRKARATVLGETPTNLDK